MLHWLVTSLVSFSLEQAQIFFWISWLDTHEDHRIVYFVWFPSNWVCLMFCMIRFRPCTFSCHTKQWGCVYPGAACEVAHNFCLSHCLWLTLITWCASLVAQLVKNLPAVQETQVWSLGQEDPLEKEMAIHSSILVWKTSWTQEPGGLQSMGLQRVGHDWETNINLLDDLNKEGGTLQVCPH